MADSYIDLDLEAQDRKIKLVDNGDGTYSVATSSSGDTSSGLTDTQLRAADVKITLDGETVGLSAGENNLGAVGGHTACIDVVPTLTVHATYATGDYVGTSATPMTFTNAARVNAGTGIIVGAVLIDYAIQSIAGELWLFDTAITPPNDSAAWSISDADAARCLGVIPFNTYYASALNSVCPIGGLTIAFQTLPASKNIYGCFVTRGAPAYASGDLTFRLRVLQD